MNLRRLFKRKKDNELTVIHSNAQYPVWEAERGYQKGGISPELAQLASESFVVYTVAAAVLKQRIETGGPDSTSFPSFQVRTESHIGYMGGCISIRDFFLPLRHVQMLR